MIRANSAGLYGTGTPLDLSRLNARRSPRAYGLRSGSSVTGYYPAYGVKPKRRTFRESVDPTTNLVAPLVHDDDMVEAPRFVREVSAIVPFDRANRPSYN